VIVLKAGFFEPADILALHECHPLLSHMLCACVHLRNYEFLWMWQYNPAWATQSSLDDDKAYAFLACLLHYNLSVALTIWFLGNNYTGEYHDIPSIMAFLRLHGIADDIISSYNRVMTMGCPNHFNASTTRDNALLYWRCSNHPSIRAKINQVMETMNKKERNNYVVHIPHWIWRFVPHCFITPQHILVKPGKKASPSHAASSKPSPPALKRSSSCWAHQTHRGVRTPSPGISSTSSSLPLSIGYLGSSLTCIASPSVSPRSSPPRL
jgi:hypothetical protein